LEEHGSAIWGNVRNINKKYRHRSPNHNILLTEHFRLSLNSRKHLRNLNVLVVGGSGSGKTRYYAKPNIMQANCSFLITDPKGELLRDTGYLLEKEGYKVRVFDLIDMEKSFCYNPFRYIRDDKDVLKLVTNLIRNTTPKTAGNIDPFWEKSETALLQALMLYLFHEAPEEEQNFTMVMEMLGNAEVREDNEDFTVLWIFFMNACKWIVRITLPSVNTKSTSKLPGKPLNPFSSVSASAWLPLTCGRFPLSPNTMRWIWNH